MNQPSRTTPLPRHTATGFTLVELLVVIAIIVLLVSIAIPSFKALTGGRSVEAAANNVSALIGRARTEAIGLQRTGGVLFYIDAATNRVAAVIVREVPPPNNNNAAPDVVYLDTIPESEFTLLPAGIMLNTVDDAAMATGNTGLRADDGLIGFNPVYLAPGSSSMPVKCGGAILFDGAGRLCVRKYRLMINDGETTELAKLLMSDRGFTTAQTMGKTAAPASFETKSSVGFVLFDQHDFQEASTVDVKDSSGNSPGPVSFTATLGDGSDGQGNMTGAMTDDEKREEAWIDQNSTPFLVARHSGALLRNQ